MTATGSSPGPRRRTSPPRRAASFDGCADPRLRELMQSLVRHLHAFAVETSLTEEEWRQLIAVAHRHRQHHRRAPAGVHPLVRRARPVDAGRRARPRAPAGRHRVDGARAVLRARVAAARVRREHGRSRPARAFRRGSTAGCSTSAGEPIAGAELDVWQNGADMLYAVQRPEAEEDHLRGRYLTRDDGTYAFVAVRPVPYPIPHDGPVGRMLAATGRHPWRPGAHPHDRARPRLQDRHHARVRRHQRVPRLGHRVRGQAVAAADVRRALAGRPRAPGGSRG